MTIGIHGILIFSTSKISITLTLKLYLYNHVISKWKSYLQTKSNNQTCKSERLSFSSANKK